MAAKTKTITVQVDERLAAEIEGTTVKFWMKSRGGIADGQVYTSKKDVTVIAGETTPTPTTRSAEPSR